MGLVGDGAFIKGNKPFKNRMELLLGKKLKFRWDILHLVNRAHVPARGISPLEKKQKTDIPADEDEYIEIEENVSDQSDKENKSSQNIGASSGNYEPKIPKTIGYIQVRFLNIENIQ